MNVREATQRASQEIVTHMLNLTEQQRGELARALSIDLRYVPKELGVVGMPKTSAAVMGIAEKTPVKFSPALIVM